MNRLPYSRYMRGNRNQRTIGLYATAILWDLFGRIMELDTKPPATIFLILFNLLIYLLPLFQTVLPSQVKPFSDRIIKATQIRTACLLPREVLSGARSRLLISAFVHVDDIHLAYNLSSFLYKGVTIEATIGSLHFLALVIFLSFTAHGIYVLVAMLMHFFGFPGLMNSCAVGFSGVIFGLKVVLNSDPTFSRTAETVFGVNLPAGGLPWAELIIASLASPNVSFLGHLSGIFAGLIYTGGMRYFTNLARARARRQARRQSSGHYAR